MQRTVRTLLVGLMLSLCGGAARGAPEVLPEGSPEEQYNFAFYRAMQNDLATAEAAFAEFHALHPTNKRAADALFWVGRIEYLRQRYEKATLTFSEFNRLYPDDPRRVDATLLTAEAVSKFAPAAQACVVYKELKNLFVSPPDNVLRRLAAISKKSNCDPNGWVVGKGVEPGEATSSGNTISIIDKTISLFGNAGDRLTDEPSNNALTSQVSPSELIAARQKAYKERQKRIELERELADLKAQQQTQQRAISGDIQIPVITILSALSNGPQGLLTGRVTDNIGIAEVNVDGNLVALDSDGRFAVNTYVPDGGLSLEVEAIDLAGLSSSMSVRLEREVSESNFSIVFDRLNPLGRNVASNANALALIIGLEQYEKTDAKAAYADSDAKVFADYASLKLGIPLNRIKTLVNDNAEITDVLLSVQDWLSRAVKQEKSDVYIFFAGHGLASDDGKKMYLLPYDGSPRLLSKTALLRDELFSDIASANPRSVTVFLDTCYSGTTRGPDMLIASRPIAIRAKEQAVPEGFTVMTAAAGDQTAKPLEEAKHGMFSYFLMKGMEGDADANQDNQITAGELQEYVYQNVVQQSSGSQTPELQGDANRVLVRFQ